MTSKRTQIMERIASAMTRLENIRNISVVAHVDHGKSTLTDALIAKAGLMSKDRAGTARFMDSRPDEQERTITIKSSSVSMLFDVATPVKNKPVDPEWQRKKATAADKDKANTANVAAKQPEQQPVPVPAPASTQASAPAPTPAVIASNDQKKDDAATATATATANGTNANGAKKVPVGYATDSYLINLIDSPGHVDFSSEVTAALRLSDGALVVVDAIESVCVQTKTVLRQALQERVRPVLFLNKLDRAFLELNQPLEELYQSLARTVESTNVIIHTYADELLGDVTVWPQNGSVGFGSGLHGWGFTLQSFARIYHDKFGISEKKMMKKLWGDNFYDAAQKKWSTEQFVTDTAADGTVTTRKLERGFCMLVLEPLRRLTRAIMAEKPDVAAYTAMIRKLSLQTPLTNSDLTGLTGKDLLKRVLQAWLPAADALTSLIVQHLPSPATAQRYRVNNLYSGPLDDECAAAIRTCDPKGPLMVAVTKMIPTADASRFFAFGRVFSGTLRVGATVRIQGPDYLADVTVGGSTSASSSSSGSGSGGDAKASSASTKSKNDLYVKPLTGAVLHMGPLTESMSVMPCGMMVGLVGVDQFLLKSGTVTSHPNAHNFNALKFSVSPIVRCAVTVADAANMPKLVVGLKRMVKADPLVTVTMSANGEHIVGCCGELHMEICLKDLRDDFMKGVALKVSDPVVSFCETVKPSETPNNNNKECIAKSLNKHNRLHVTAEALGEPFCRAVDAGELGVGGDAKAMAHRLREDFAWDLTEAKKIWSFGQSDGIANVLVDRTKAVPYLPDARDVIVAAFREQTNIGGVYTGEPLRGVRFNVTDAKLHAEAVHRGPRQLNAVVVDAMKGALIAATPALMEPVYQCDIAVPQSASAGVYATLRARRATIVELDDGKSASGSGSDAKAVGDMVRISAYLPVTESFGFGQLLRKNTSGQAFPQMLFSHWAVMPGTCSDASTLAGQTVAALRERKGMKPVLPKFDDFNVKL